MFAKTMISLATIIGCTSVMVIAQTTAITTTQTVSVGTIFETKLQQDISTGKNIEQQQFILQEKHGLFGGNTILKNSTVEGHLENVVKAAKGVKASLHLYFDDIILKDGSRYPLNASLVNTDLQTKTQGTLLRNVGILVGGAVAGHYLGKTTGVPLGTMGGTAAASAYVLNSPGGEVILKKGTVLKLKLNSPLMVR